MESQEERQTPTSASLGGAMADPKIVPPLHHELHEIAERMFEDQSAELKEECSHYLSVYDRRGAHVGLSSGSMA